MDRRIENLKSTTFFGQRLTRKRIAFIQETVSLLPHLARSELGMTLCEQLHWKTPQGSSRIQFALSVLEELERLSILTLPPKRTSGRGPQKPIQCCSLTDPQPAIEGPLADLTPLKLQLASSAEHVAAWNTWVQRYHPLGYRRPLGPPPALLPARPRHQRKLGWLLFGFAARSVACRDAWIGWQGQAHRKHLDLVVRNSRFLVFPEIAA